MSQRPWPAGVIEGVAKVLGDTDNGMTGTQIGELLTQLNLDDPGPGVTKWKRLHVALQNRQVADGSPRRTVTAITQAMEPSRYVGRPDLYAWRQGALNEVLTFVGLRVNDRGRVAHAQSSATLSEAAERASSLMHQLKHRGVHDKVLQSCSREVLMRNAFHASLEAIKGIFERIREETRVEADGARLVDATLTLGKSGSPRLAINALATESERDEQTGFAALLKGLAQMYRNPVAHDPRTRRAVSDLELLELLTMVSMVHRRLDGARHTATEP
ncbi:TIGR02391 family protein [Georgenia muralis]